MTTSMKANNSDLPTYVGQTNSRSPGLSEQIPIHNKIRPESEVSKAGWLTRDDIISTIDITQAEFDDVMQQPTTPLTIPGINVFFSVVFKYTQAAIYTLLTLITGIFLTIAWGIVFSIFSYINVWIIKPAIHLVIYIMTPFGQLYRYIVRVFIDPVFEAIGQTYAYIRGNFKLSVNGILKETTLQTVKGDHNSPGAAFTATDTL